MIPSWATDILRSHKSRNRGDSISLQTCPYCRNNRWNFEISISKCVTHCWVCDSSSFITKLLFDLGISYDRDSIKPRYEKKQVDGPLQLPDCKKVRFNDSVVAKRAIQYLNSRGMDQSDIEDWDVRIGTGADAAEQKARGAIDYFGWTIIPFYGIQGLEFYCGINHTLGKRKYHLPPASKDRYVPKTRGSSEIILVEGIFDGTSAWKYTDSDVFVLFGKFLGEHQFEMLVRANYDKVYVCLDSDAEKQSAELADNLFRAGAKAYIVKLPDGHDPNSLGAGISDCMNSATQVGVTTKSRMRREWLLNAK